MAAKIDRYDNIECSIKDGVLTLRICVDEAQVDAQPSKSGKTIVIATSGGAMRIPDTALKLNLTLYRK